MGYYAKKLSGERLSRCYELASPRVRRYLEAEIDHARERIHRGDRVLELGCGCGRIVERLAGAARSVVGIDSALSSLELARRLMGDEPDLHFLAMDALRLGFRDRSFDVVLCLQNGICAFGADPVRLLEEALRVTREGGLLLLSSYSDRFWEHRLAWFEAQAAEGLLGPIDREASQGGWIVCEDGFRSGRFQEEEFRRLCSELGVVPRILEVDGSSVFCEITRS